MTLTEEFENNFIIISESRELSVDKFQIATRMIKFKKDTAFFLSGIYHLKTKCSDSILENFIEAAKIGKCPEFTLDNVPSYQNLSLEFEFNSLFDKCNSFLLGQHNLPELISNLLSTNNNSPTVADKEATLNAIEVALAFNLTQQHIDQLKCLPNAVLYRILSNPQRPTSPYEKSIYDIIKTKIDGGDQDAQFLLKTIDYRSLNHSDLSSIINHHKKSNKNTTHNNKSNQNQNNRFNQNPNSNPNPNQNNQTQNQVQQQRNTPQIQPASTASPQQKTENSEKNQPPKAKITRANVSTRAASTTNIADSFNPVYIPPSSNLKKAERRIIEIVNTRRSSQYPLTLNQEVSNRLQSYYGSLEEIKPPSETDYLILRDRFSLEVDQRHLFLGMQANENEIYAQIRSEIKKIPIKDISNSNFLALTFVQISGNYFYAMIIGSSDLGKDQIDSNPPKNDSDSNPNLPPPTAKPSSSSPNISIDLFESIQSAFYQSDSYDVQNIFFNKEISSQLMSILDKIDQTGDRLTQIQVFQTIPALQGSQVYVRVSGQMNTFLDGIKQQNKSKNGCILALASKQFKNNRFACIIAYIDEALSEEQKELINSLLSISKEKFFDYNIYKQLKEFISTPQGLPELGDSLDQSIKTDGSYKFIFLKGQKSNEIISKLTSRFRNKLVLSSKYTSVITKLPNPDSFQLIVVYSK